MFITSAITYVYLNTTDNLKIEPDKITINIVETDRKNNKKGVFGETMLENLDDVKIVFEEEPNKNSISQSSEIINNDIHNNKKNRFEEEPNIIVFEEEPNKNSISQSSEIIDNDMHNNKKNCRLQCLTDCWNKIKSICGN